MNIYRGWIVYLLLAVVNASVVIAYNESAVSDQAVQGADAIEVGVATNEEVPLMIQKQSSEYRKKRDVLLEAEKDLIVQRENVAELRRQLPLSAAITTDYLFDEGPADLTISDPATYTKVTMSSLFEGDNNELIVIHMMFDPEADRGCPMCSLWVDGYNAIVPHMAKKVNLVVVAKAELSKLRGYAKERGWNNVRILSSYHNRFNRDYGVEADSGQMPGVSVFVRKDDSIHHFYTTEGSLGFTHHRGIDLFSPLWHLYDLLPSGRSGHWMPLGF